MERGEGGMEGREREREREERERERERGVTKGEKRNRMEIKGRERHNYKRKIKDKSQDTLPIWEGMAPFPHGPTLHVSLKERVLTSLAQM